MTRLVHLTDLHFGLHRADLVQSLHDSVVAAEPDIVVVSGDFTQRARAGQFRASIAFLEEMALPFFAVPGNHDIPLFNPLLRLVNPFGRYRKGVGRDLAPTLQVGRLRLYGTNTADPHSWRGGIARQDEIDRICRSLGENSGDVTNILVCHHPLEEPPGFQRGETRGAKETLARLADAGMHVALSGHLHHWSMGLGIGGQVTRPIFQMQTGTALCNRARERDHGFAVLEFDTDRLNATSWIVNEACLQFEPRDTEAYTFRNGSWHQGG